MSSRYRYRERVLLSANVMGFLKKVNARMESFRQLFVPLCPHVLQDVLSLCCVEERRLAIDPEVKAIFPHSVQVSVLRVERKSVDQSERSPLRVGVVLSGGPAPGGHNVIAGLFDSLKVWNDKSILLGFLEGPKGLLYNAVKEIHLADINEIRNTGGFSLIGTGRAKIETPEDIKKVIATVKAHNLDGLVIIGGDDSNTDAAFLSEAFLAAGLQIAVVGVPKTIDGDLQSEDIPISFGFDTACKVYSEIIGNIARDVLSVGKYYFFIKLMGRIASHITLECALQTHPNLALMSEEVAEKKLTLKELILEIADLVEERHALKKDYGIILVPEGLVEHIVDVKQLIHELNELFASTHPLFSFLETISLRGARLDFVLEHISESSRNCLSLFPRQIAEELIYERDPHGNVQVSRIETEKLLATLVEQEIHVRSVQKNRAIPFFPQTYFCGYEGRSAYPSFFDCTYCYALGKIASVLIAKRHTGYMTALSSLHKSPEDWVPHAVPLTSLLHFERRKGKRKAVIKRTLVDLQGPIFSFFRKERDAWRLSDAYGQPGPMQFWGPDELSQKPCVTIMLKDL